MWYNGTLKPAATASKPRLLAQVRVQAMVNTVKQKAMSEEEDVQEDLATYPRSLKT